jgi:DNA-binding ferritin-like protein
MLYYNREMSKKVSKKNNLFSVFFELQINVKTFHWLTKSYPKHKATDKLYDSLNDNIDKFIEIYMGKYDRPIIKHESISFKHMTDGEFIQYIKTHITFFEKDLLHYIKANDTDLLNIRDEIVGNMNQTLYLFTLN